MQCLSKKLKDENSFSFVGKVFCAFARFEKRPPLLRRSLNKAGTIPTLVMLDNKGKVLTRNGRNAIDDDPNAFWFPWEKYEATYKPPNVWMRVFIRIFLFVGVAFIYRYYYGPGSKSHNPLKQGL